MEAYYKYVAVLSAVIATFVSGIINQRLGESLFFPRMMEDINWLKHLRNNMKR